MFRTFKIDLRLPSRAIAYDYSVIPSEAAQRAA
jgi:hypothetical protein